ncbi:Sugar kinase of the NBD/HSP70 family, may contain an N-terminal HTH domain [Clostridium cavendishii DSM 21758]|uniref:Sugar kinase of the NBD/HSP70 family, may contain an N-terminal HTH domain n=1 Tax=Clostridium cavendishii DSM 21758 TaxID=1121302 RepID=A0A1M6MVB1_9CLOT|nr:ROK family protein [Clostridium cavendishii]SHJ87411.1 Sugar kinase of the NBD/HSP70 family, may contain an N-terminal HTH domain [Clostridium cavendishii DSM 21758]
MRYYMTFDIGGTNIKYGVINDNAEILEKGSIKTPQNNIEELIDVIGDVTKDYIDKYKFEGIAISSPGAVDDLNGVVKGASALPYIHGPKIKELITKRTSLKVYMENDANCAALAEVWNGAAKDAKDVLFVVCGTGIGGAVIKDRKLHTGANLHGGEFGYMLLQTDLKDAKDRNWSRIASTGAMVRKACELKGINESSLDGKRVFELAESGDQDCIKAIDMFYQNLAVGIYNLQYIYDPEMIIIGGAISERKDIIDNINNKLKNILDTVEIAKIFPTVKSCEYFNDANLLGAVYNFKVKNELI